MGAAALRGAGAQRAAAELHARRLRHAARALDRAGGVRARRRRWGSCGCSSIRWCSSSRRWRRGSSRQRADAGGELRDRAQREPQSALRTVTGMSLVNFTAREITCKIVYYGPGRSGKTTNLQYVYGRVPESRRGRMVSLATQTDRTLFFDFLPLELGTISGFTTKFQLYTVPGPELLQRHPEAGAPGRRRRRLRGRQPGPPLRRQPREPAEPAGQPAGAGRRHPPAAGRVPVQQAGPAAAT